MALRIPAVAKSLTDIKRNKHCSLDRERIRDAFVVYSINLASINKCKFGIDDAQDKAETVSVGCDDFSKRK